MKRVYLIISLLTICGSLLAQIPTSQRAMFSTKKITKEAESPLQTKALGIAYLISDFSTPGDWVLNNAGQASPMGWTIDAVNDSWAFGSAIASTSGGNYLELYNGDPLTNSPAPSNATFTATTASPIDIPALTGGNTDVTIQFEQYGARFQDIQEVLVSTDGITFVSVGNNDDIEALTSAGGAPYDNPMLRTYDISSAIAGNPSTVWIRFSWSPGVQNITYGWFVDDVNIVTKPDNDIKTGDNDWGSLGLHYHQIPLNQVAPIDFWTKVSNEGSDVQTGVTLNVDVNSGANTVSSAGVTVVPLASDSLVVSGLFTPSAIGNYSFTMDVTADLVDDVPANNQLTGDSFVVNDYIYARDTDGTPGAAGGEDGNAPGDFGFEAGNRFDIFTDQQASGINVVIGAGTPAGTIIYGKIYVLDAAGNFVYLDETAEYTTVAADIGTEKTLGLFTSPTLSAGNVYLVMVGCYTEFYYGTSGFSPNQTSFITYGGWGGTGSQYYTNNTPMVRLNFSPVPEVNFNTSSVSVNESAGTMTVQVDIANSNSTATTVEVALGASTATSGVDFSYTNPTTVFFPAGSSTSQSVTLSIIDDAVVEVNENIVLNLQNASNSATIGTTSQHIITIIDNDLAPSPVLSFNASFVSVNESAGTITVQVDIASPNSNATTVEVALGVSTATSGSDFTFTNPTTVFFPAGSSTSQLVTLSIIDDAVVEGNENIVLNLQNASNSATIGTTSQHIITIIDNDVAPSPVLSFNASSVSVNESAGTMTVQVDIASPNSTATTVEVALGASTATSGVDFSYSNPTTVFFPAGSSTSQLVTLSIIDDAVVEGNENIVLNLQNASNSATIGTTSQHIITIIDNDVAPSPVLSFNASSVSVNESAGTITVQVDIASPNSNATTVEVALGASTATSGSDFTFTNLTTVFFPAGSSTSQSVTLSIIDDAVAEGNESIVLNLQNTTNSATIGTASQHTITIQDNDQSGVPVLSFEFGSFSVNEYEGTLNFNVNILSPNSNATSVDVVLGNSSAINGIDFVYYTTQTIVFPAGSSASQSFSFSVIDDAQNEGNENVVFYFQNATNGAVFGTNDLLTITIIDDEAIGLDENGQDLFIVYPNPTEGQFTLQMDKKIKGRVEVTNNLGQVLINEVITDANMQFDLSSVSSKGMYLLKVYSLEGKLLQLRKILHQ